MDGNEKKEDVVLSIEELEKSWADSKSMVQALLGDEPEVKKAEEKKEDLEKAKKKGDDEKDMEYDEEDEDEEEDEEEEEEGKKSLEDFIEDDPEAQAAMDVEPFLRQFAKSLGSKIDSIEKKINGVKKMVEAVDKLQKATSKMVISYGELQKSTHQTVEKIGGQPVQSASILRKGGEKFEAQKTEMKMDKDQILQKSLELRKSGKLTLRDVTNIEGRLNKGIPLPDSIVEILNKEEVK